MNQFVMLGCLWLGACATAFSQQQTNGVNYQLGPMPSVHKPLAKILFRWGIFKLLKR